MSEIAGPKGDGTVQFPEVLRREYAALWLRRPIALAEAAGEVPASGTKAPPALYGVALSGGGIRSSSFCLGALQALDRLGLAQRIDYLSTVSGGGYVGASMISAMHQNGEQFPFSCGKESDVHDNEPVSNLRDNSRFLAPRGLPDLLISLAVVLRGLVVNFILVLCIVLPLASVLILANPTKAHLERSVVADVIQYFAPEWLRQSDRFRPIIDVVSDPFILTKVFALLLFLTALAWALRRSIHENRLREWDPPVAEQESRWALVIRSMCIVLAVCVFLELQPPILFWISHQLSAREDGVTGVGSLWTVGVAIVTVTATFREQLVRWVQKALGTPSIAEMVKAWFARSLIYTAGLVLPLLIYVFFLWLTLWGIRSRICDGSLTEGAGSATACAATSQTLAGAPAALMLGSPAAAVALGIACIAMAILALIYVSEPGTRRVPRLQPFLRSVAARPVAVLFLLCTVGFLVLSAIATRRMGAAPAQDWMVLAQFGLMTLLVCLVGWQFTENANGLHRLYRDRLNAAFRLDRGKDGPIRLSHLGDDGPYLLVNATLNARESDPGAGADDGQVNQRSLPDAPVKSDPARRGRNAEFFLFSRFYTGSAATGYVGTKSMEEAEPQLDLATAVAISGAAISSSMGRIRIGLLAPTLALLNLRLGFWLSNPRVALERGRRGGSQPAAEDNRKWYDVLRLYLFAEAFGKLRADSSRVYVTDGGHIDNIGLYQLLKRRCRYIVVVDGEADPGMTFGALCDVQRFARIDEGVKIKIDWLPIRDAALSRMADRTKRASEEDDAHRRHFAVGRIFYEKRGDGTDEGLLVYVKASVTGDEADYVLDYERRYPAFPHESTGDQFFSEEQMEAYRSLGYHCVDRMLQSANDVPLAYAEPDGEERNPVAHMIRELKATATVTRPYGGAAPAA